MVSMTTTLVEVSSSSSVVAKRLALHNIQQLLPLFRGVVSNAAAAGLFTRRLLILSGCKPVFSLERRCDISTVVCLIVKVVA